MLYVQYIFCDRSKDQANFYRRGKRNFEKLEYVGKWDMHTSNRITKHVFQAAHLSNLYGKTLRATSFEYKPYTYVTDYKIDGMPAYDGIEVMSLIKHNEIVCL